MHQHAAANRRKKCRHMFMQPLYRRLQLKCGTQTIFNAALCILLEKISLTHCLQVFLSNKYDEWHKNMIIFMLRHERNKTSACVFSCFFPTSVLTCNILYIDLQLQLHYGFLRLSSGCLQIFAQKSSSINNIYTAKKQKRNENYYLN